MRNVLSTVSAATMTALLVFAMPHGVEARPQYVKAFKAAYPDLEEKFKEHNCGVCHGGAKGAKKKILSDYGKVLRELLVEGGADEKKVNEKDEAKIADAVKKAEDKESSPGKTYGEILKGGDLPPLATDEE